ncbi:MAG: hypothetical protein KatS3mg124_0893 [Porticoccaceae bacterium]|nr:MAG: hypothetical protein KatS3mg124_0893 [Porticoccaceae bacterium]
MVRSAPLAARLALGCTLLALGFVAALGGFLLYDLYRQELDALAAEVEARANHRLLGFAVARRDRALLAELLTPHRNWGYVVVHGGDELIYARAQDGASLPARVLAPGALGPVPQQRRVHFWDRRWLEFAVPLYAPRQVLEGGSAEVSGRWARADRLLVGHLRVGVAPPVVFRGLLHRLAGLLFPLGLAAGGLLLALWLWLRRALGPLEALPAVAEALAGRRFDRGLPVGGCREVRTLARALDAALAALERESARSRLDARLLTAHLERHAQQLRRRNAELRRALVKVCRAQEELALLAYRDTLTDLPNRQAFLEQLPPLVAAALASGERLALALLDLDDFKRINDTLGHGVGDQVLLEIAARLERAVAAQPAALRLAAEPNADRPALFRLSGGQFAVCYRCPQGRQEAQRMARQLLEQVAAPLTADFQTLVVTASAGLALAPEDGEDPRELARLAEAAMFAAKRAGPNALGFPPVRDRRRGAVDLRVETDLRRAIEAGELDFYFQPKIRLGDGRVVGAEALVRWHHPDVGSLPTGELIARVEALGLVSELGRVALEVVCGQFAALRTRGLALPSVAVNVAPRQFSSALLTDVEAAMRRHGLAPGELVLEITENTLLRQDQVIEALFGDLRELGVRLAVDDFGTGYSALNYLARLPVDELKIDRSFVVGLGSPEGRRRAVVEAIAALARGLELAVVAEGVERPDQLQALAAMGVQSVQGFLLCPPLPFEAFARFLQGLSPWVPGARGGAMGPIMEAPTSGVDAMKEWVTESETRCPFDFNFDPATFKPGDLVSYRVPDPFGDMPFVGELVEVHEDYVVLKHYGLPEEQTRLMRGTRESRPRVSKEDALG